MPITTLLFVSGASLVGQNAMDALAHRRCGLRLVATNSLASEPTLFDFDEVYLTPSLRDDPSGFQRRFQEILETVEPHLVIPCRDDDILFLARLQEASPDWHGRFLCGNAGLAEVMLDKFLSWEFSQRHDLPYVPTMRLDAEPDAIAAFVERQGFPLIAKPREGFASRGVSLLLDEKQLRKTLGRPNYILQQYLGEPEPIRAYARQVAEEGIPLFHSHEGVKHSIQAFITPAGEMAGLFATCNTMRSGKSDRVEVDPAPDVPELGRRCAEAFAAQGWRGPLNIQCQRAPDGKMMIYEYNGRFTGATAGRYLLGYDEIGLAMQTFSGLGHWDEGTALGQAVIRLPQSRAIEATPVAELRKDGYWVKPSRSI